MSARNVYVCEGDYSYFVGYYVNSGINNIYFSHCIVF